MQIKNLIKKLEKMDPNAEIRLHDKSGEPVLFVVSAKKYPDVWLQTEGDVDMADEIQSRFDGAIDNGTDELDVYMEMLDCGIDISMVRKYIGNEAADHMQEFCEEHGLLEEIQKDSKKQKFMELYKKYGLNNPNKSRENLPEAEKRKFVSDCFDTYEHIGFAETFRTPYEEEQKYVGMKFKVINRVKDITKDSDNGADLECLPMWNIKFENGDTMSAYPEEICLAER